MNKIKHWLWTKIFKKEIKNFTEKINNEFELKSIEIKNLKNIIKAKNEENTSLKLRLKGKTNEEYFWN